MAGEINLIAIGIASVISLFSGMGGAIWGVKKQNQY